MLHVNHIIGTTLTALADVLNKPALDTELAFALLFETGLVESAYKFPRQLNGPGSGFWSVEPGTAEEVIRQYPQLFDLRAGAPPLFAVPGFSFRGQSDPDQTVGRQIDLSQMLEGNIWLCAAVARLVYWPVVAPIPATLAGRGQYWADHYNTRGSSSPYLVAATLHGLTVNDPFSYGNQPGAT